MDMVKRREASGSLILCGWAEEGKPEWLHEVTAKEKKRSCVKPQPRLYTDQSDSLRLSQIFSVGAARFMV